MNNIQVISNEWIDIILLNNETKIAKRKTNNDIGIYSINENENENENILEIEWNIWGKESFFKKNNIYYNSKFINIFFEIFLENNEWCDIGIFNINDNTIKRKYCPNECGIFIFDNNDLIIKWDNWGNERFYQLNYGKCYTNTKFGNIIKNNIKREIKILAIVFPQFHEIPENNSFWGHGFTEWTLLRNIPRIVNNEIIKQPHDDIGYFNLKDFEHRKYMRILANKYNIFGFCIYHYWFKDKKVMYEPTELMLNDNEPNKPFLFCWANEQWTKRWDGGNNEILIKQDYSDSEGNIKHFNYLLQFFKNKNYIKKFNKPIFIFYRIEENEIEHIKNIIKLWNKLAIENNFNGIHFMKFLGPFNNNIILDEIDGYIEFEPGYVSQKNFNDIHIEDDNKIFNLNDYNEELYLKKNSDVRELLLNNKISSGYEHYLSINDKEKKIRTSKFFVYDGEIMYKKIIDLERLHNEQHRGICVNWNNTPRRNYVNDEYDKYPHYYKNINSSIFGVYFKKLLNKIDNDKNNENDFLFISAWNEWNEQAILEPNNEDGYNYLKEISTNYLDFYNNPKKYNILNISHYGGGTEKYMNDLKNIFYENNFINFNCNEIYNNIDLIHINSFLFSNFKNNYTDFFLNNMKDIKKYITIHDYQWLYPDNPNIIKSDFDNQIPNNENISNFEILLSLCDKIIFPSNNIYNNYNIYIKLNNYHNKIFIINHSDKIINHNFLVIPKIENVINIAFIGYYVEYKGSKIFEQLIYKFKYYKNFKIIYHIFGMLSNNIDDTNMDKEYIIIHNEYCDNNIIKKLHDNKIHGILHLSLFEESYCYALTNSINSGIPILYINNGCIEERLNKNKKYFPSQLNNIIYKFIDFLDYIIDNNNIYDFYTLNNNINPNKWYLLNYI